ncbi:hypothetical protein [Streptomyces hesseae]|uniref:Indole-3-glycerol phosphate synthase n=1 Tax=Streptomyces hesseae TaxID=3075519 RepID=A0ABU2SJS9_9ACTN|nr:hypothetical protein [Streptomyces sp. DSM 40473]MDT0449229.1 hypothetical protein [Streptomyces sp. DSM 40473]
MTEISEVAERVAARRAEPDMDPAPGPVQGFALFKGVKDAAVEG